MLFVWIVSHVHDVDLMLIGMAVYDCRTVHCNRGDDPTTTGQHKFTFELRTSSADGSALDGEFNLWFMGETASVQLSADGISVTPAACEAVSCLRPWIRSPM